jgi:two-component system cell cycle response regulator DivK
MLEGAGYEIVEAVTGAEGIAKAETEHPDLVLMAMQLPVLDGYESPRRIKALPGMVRTTVIAVSSFAMKGGRGKGASCRLRCLTKPL